MRDILERVRKSIEPGKNIIGQVQATVDKINKALKDNEINAECMIGGSFAKDTYLRGDHDVDLFVRFDYSYLKEDISKILAKVLPYKAEKLPGSRDYFQFEKNKLLFEVVPVLKVNKPELAENVTDMSPLHVDYVKKHVKRQPGLNNEIRLAKQFCKANKVYGAESYIQGFSGHVVDLLVIYYGDFLKLVSAAANWKERVVIDMEAHWSNPLKQLNKSKLESPLVLVDPLQPDRNASAAMSKDTFELFKARCKEFLANPSINFFKQKKIDLDELEKKKGDNYIVVLEMWPYKKKNDVMGAKLKQAHEYIFNKLKEREWPVLDADWEFIKGSRRKVKDPFKQPRGIFYYIISKKISKTIELKGPPITQKEDVRRFTKKHPHNYIKGERIYAKTARKYSNPEDKIDEILDHKYLKERAKNVDFIEV